MKTYLVISVRFMIIMCMLGAFVPAVAQLPGGKKYLVEREREILKQESGSHNGGGNTIVFPFFAKADSLKLVLKKRILYPGSSIGYHYQESDEIFYIVAGHGEMKMNNETFLVNAGDAILTRPGNWHGLKPTGNDSLVVIINYINNAVKK